ncbi:MFS transporter [Perlucidibaca aquatica]|uniref:MFS transporter n=1 Tax=Perlucidibaca aquatica TaxID=1852776 RepID=UPI00083A84AA|nr:MFS transporter [Perlucidibaca aquatica]
MTSPVPLAPKREIVGWAMYDFANQAYTLLIITVVFGDLFTRVIVGDGPDYRLGNLLWSVAIAVSCLAVALVNPICGAVMDYTATRKRYLFMTYVLTVIGTALLYFVEPGWIALAMLLIIITNFAFALGEGIIASFLTDLGPRDALGWISGLGWGLGYIGGLVATAFSLSFLGEVSLANYDTVRWVGPFAAVFVCLGCIPTFLWLRERGTARQLPAGESVMQRGLVRLRETWLEMRQFQDLRRLLISIFFSMAGIAIIVSFAFIYGAQVIKWDDSVRTMMFVIVQFNAAVGAIAFGILQSRLGSRFTYMLSQGLWVVAILAIWLTPEIAALAREQLGVNWQAQYVFLFAGCLAGLSLGSAQSAGRALVGFLTPAGKSAEFFGMWGTAAKLAAVFGMLGLGLLQTFFGLADAILFCLVLFAVSMWVVSSVDETRGRAAADQWCEPIEGKK